MPNTLYDLQDPLGRIEGEKARHIRALNRYARLGSRRTLKMLATVYQEEEKKRKRGEARVPEPPTTSYGTLSDWSSRFHWQNRVLQWEMLQRADEEAEWKERRKKVREDDWSHSAELRELAERIIKAAPAFINQKRRVVDDGVPRIVNLDGEVIKEGRPKEIVTTVALDITALEKVEKLASKLARMSAEMDQARHHVSVDWRNEAENAGLDPAEAFEQLVESYVTSISAGNEPDDGGGAEGSPA